MKLKLIALAALAVSGVAHAALDGTATTNGSVAFLAYDNTGTNKSSVYADLGFNVQDFFNGDSVLTSTGVVPLSIGVLANNNTTVKWDFAANTITFNGTVKNVTNDFSGVLSFLSQAQTSEIRFGVTGQSNLKLNAAGDTFILPYTSLVTGNPSAAALANQGAGNNSNLIGITGDQLYNTYGGLITGTEDNGSYFASNSGDAGYLAKSTIFGTNFNGLLAWNGMTALTSGVGKTNAYILDGEGFNWAVGNHPEGANANLLNNKGTFTFDATAKTLTWATPVPEAESYALALAGLGLLAAVARRRAAR